jgi:hypothetical protein
MNQKSSLRKVPQFASRVLTGNNQIANDIGMSRQNVEHYMRFRDQMQVGADGQKRLRLVNSPERGD